MASSTVQGKGAAVTSNPPAQSTKPEMVKVRTRGFFVTERNKERVTYAPGMEIEVTRAEATEYARVLHAYEEEDRAVVAARDERAKVQAARQAEYDAMRAAVTADFTAKREAAKMRAERSAQAEQAVAASMTDK